MRVADAVHRAAPWRIHPLVADFRLEDVWALPARGGPGDFPEVVAEFARADPERESRGLTALLWKARWAAGRLLGWDDERAGLGARVGSLRSRLPADLRDGPTGPAFASLPFVPLYLTDDEWACEVANRTMHGVMHLAWAPTGAGDFEAQMAVYVKTNGVLGDLYMAAIRPFRHHVVYPQMMRRAEARWRARQPA